MKIAGKNKFLLGAIVSISAIGTAQTINTGELFIAPNAIMASVEELDNSSSGELVNNGELYLYSHYINDGLVGFTNGGKTGTTILNGKKGYQDISGTVPMLWNHVRFDNVTVQPAFHLDNEIRISGKAIFENGIVNGADYTGLMVFEQSAYHDRVSDMSHVNGSVRKNGKDAFIFPIGDGSYYRQAGISVPENSADAFLGKYFFKDSDFYYPHSSKEEQISVIDNSEYWTIEKVAGNANIFLTLSWNESTTPSDIYSLPYDEIHIVRWDEVLNKWIDMGGAVNSDTKEVSMVIEPLKSYGVFTLARVKMAPTDLVVYNAVSPNGDGMNDYFKINGIENYKKNKVEIYNRWGVKVYESSGYDNVVNTFKGFSEGRATVGSGEMLPVGTYFYIINAENDNGGKGFKKSGYLYLSY